MLYVLETFFIKTAILKVQMLEVMSRKHNNLKNIESIKALKYRKYSISKVKGNMNLTKRSQVTYIVKAVKEQFAVTVKPNLQFFLKNKSLASQNNYCVHTKARQQYTKYLSI